MAELLCLCNGRKPHNTPDDPWTDNFRDILKRKFAFTDYGMASPPFTPRQIFTMAILSHPYHRVPSCIIPACVRAIFPGLYRIENQIPLANALSPPNIRATMVDELRAFDSPFHIDEDGQMTLRSGLEDEGLRQKPKTNRKIPFMDFPSELRLEVYRHALVFTTDESGVEIMQSPHAWSARDSDAYFWITLNGVKNCVIYARQTLALLCVNKQLNAEAKPVFYGQNHFIFSSIEELLLGFLSGIGHDRRQHLRSVSILYPAYWMSKPEKSLIESAFFLLFEANLQYLHLDMIDEESHFRRGRRKKDPARQIPGLWILGKFRGLKEVTFDGERYERTEKFLKDEMLKPKGDRGERALLKRKR